MQMYSKLTSKISYKILMVVPIIVAAIMLVVISINGFHMSFEFSGGKSLEIDLKYKNLTDEQIDDLRHGLNLENLKVSKEGDIVKITTTSKISDIEFLSLVEKYTGRLSTNNVFAINLNYKISNEERERLESRFKDEIKITESGNSTKIVIERRHMSEEEMKTILSDPRYNINFDEGSYSFEHANANVGSVSPVIGVHLKEEMIFAAIAAFILIFIVVFVAYRILIPVVAIVAAASIDIIFAAGCMSIFNIELNLPTFVALLMLLGYSVDTDILLTTRLLKRKTIVNETIDETMKTGLTMTFTAMGAAATMMIVSNLTTPRIEVISELSSVILLGLFMDIFSTWFMNTGILKWYIERKQTIKRRKFFKFSLFSE